MKTEDFVVSARPRLAAISDFPMIEIAEYEPRLRSMQNTLQLVQQAYLGTSERAVVVLEGWDTAGKGGVVRRLGWALDPRSFKVHPISAPSPRERTQHYLQRFWERLPEQGQIVLFDRSWYGRVLVERVEELADAAGGGSGVVRRIEEKFSTPGAASIERYVRSLTPGTGGSAG